MLHVNPKLDERALLMVFNPLDVERTKSIRVPLYYAGLTDLTEVEGEAGGMMTLSLDRNYSVELEVTVPANSQTWFVFR